ncbi:fimbria/pilus periplasmic chaperone [uncultured Stenotrophomonas sp.]|uniref:fimbrial biogenesis chaperone n=1 Tax=uncultured Stenotrophomonas sp. TaxID=165438 RepID=UPI0028E673AF|nr:fimbria/pilus periplasmic chaperone [uncultured Stenotrophomonas sp.]
MADHHVLSTRRLQLGGLLAAMLLGGTAQALEVSPLRVELAPGQAHAELWLYNDSAQPWAGQAQLYAWEQTTHEELLRPAAELAVSPAELQLPAHGRQRVRVVRLGPAPAAEQGYRLLLRAGPDNPPVQVSLPVFVAGAAVSAAPMLAVRLLDEGEPAVLELYNGGARHARLADLAWVAANGQTRPILPGLAGYVLAGQTRRWVLPGTAEAYRGGRFSARIGDQAAQVLEGQAPSIATGTPAGL